MELPVSDKTSAFGKKPHIKKGYYPAKLMGVEPYKNSDGNLVEGKYGTQLIMEFCVFKADDAGTPVERITYTDEETPNKVLDVLIPKFVYFQYKDKKTGNLQTAITPKSAITKIFLALGWEFDATKPLLVEDYVGKWAEINVDDYEAKDGEETYKASTIKDINPYDGLDVPEKMDTQAKEAAEEAKPKKVEKQVKHDAVSKEDDAKLDEIQKRKETMKSMLDDKSLTQEGYDQAIEQLNKQEEELKKK